MSVALQIPQKYWDRMLEHVKKYCPEEACGLAGGIGSRVLSIFPITNTLRSPILYRMDPEQQVMAMLWMEENDMEIIAIFHSHPNGPPFPSEKDISEFAYPGVITLIWAKEANGWILRGFLIKNSRVTEISLRVG